MLKGSLTRRCRTERRFPPSVNKTQRKEKMV
nr:MAG TPA: hypothetical protein [Caudoviricetes sp.]